VIVGYLLRTHSATFWLFPWSGSITSRVTGTQRYSKDLEQGGLEIPCTLIFQGEPSRVGNVERLMKEAKEKATEKAEAKAKEKAEAK